MNNSFILACKTATNLIGTASKKFGLNTAQPRIILGLSGGPDSVFLFHTLVELQANGLLTFIAAHLDHEWRSSSAADADFCSKLCQEKNIPLVNAKGSELNLTTKFNGSHEDIGRRMRRHFFEQVRQGNNADFIVLAHHRQDQQETFFLRLLRGTTLSGLTCMKTIDGRYLRPLLELDKAAMIAYLTANNLSFCIDPTNEAETYLRNRIRKYIIPACKASDARFDQKLDSTIAHLQDEDAYLQKVAQESFEQIFTKNGHLTGDLTALRTLHPVLQRRVIMIWLITQGVSFTPSAAFLDELCRFINTPTGGCHQLGTWSIIKKGALVWIK